MMQKLSGTFIPHKGKKYLVGKVSQPKQMKSLLKEEIESKQKPSRKRNKRIDQPKNKQKTPQNKKRRTK